MAIGDTIKSFFGMPKDIEALVQAETDQKKLAANRTNSKMRGITAETEKSTGSANLKASYHRLAAYVETLPSEQQLVAVEAIPTPEGAEIVRSAISKNT